MGQLSLLFSQNALLAGTLVLVLGLWTYADRKADRRNEPVAAFLVAVALWLFAFVLWTTAEGSDQATFWLRTLYFIASFLPPFLYLLIAARWKGPKAGMPFVAALLAPNVFVFWAAYMTDAFVPVAGEPLLGGTVARIAAVIFAFYSVAAFDAALRTAREEAVKESRMFALVAGLFAILPASFALLYYGDMTAAANPFWYGNHVAVFIAVGAILVSYAVDPDRFHKRLHPAGLQAFALLATFALIVDILISRTALDLTIRLVMLIILIIAGSAAARGAVHEIDRLSEIALMNEELVRVNGRLIEADKMKTRLVSFASHQLRAPIGGVKSYLAMLGREEFGPLNQKQRQIIASNLDAVTRMGDTVDTFLDVAKIDLGKMELFRTDTNLAALIARITASFAPLAGGKKLSLVSDLPTDLPNAYCDSGKLYHAIANLVHNSIKYTQKGGILIEAQRDGDGVSVKITDTGIGISPAGKKKVQELLDGGIDHVRFDETGGSGLGLYIVKTIVEAHGGKVLFDSPGKGKGSTFGFRIPLH